MGGSGLDGKKKEKIAQWILVGFILWFVLATARQFGKASDSPAEPPITYGFHPENPPVTVLAAEHRGRLPRAVQRFQMLQKRACKGDIDLNDGLEDLIASGIRPAGYDDTGYWPHFNRGGPFREPYDNKKGRCLYNRYQGARNQMRIEYMDRYMNFDEYLIKHYAHYIRQMYSAAIHGSPGNNPVCNAKIVSWTTIYPAKFWATEPSIEMTLHSKMTSPRMNKYRDFYCLVNYDDETGKYERFTVDRTPEMQEAIEFLCPYLTTAQPPEPLWYVVPTVDIKIRYQHSGKESIWSMVFPAPDGWDELADRQMDWQLWEVEKEFCPTLMPGYQKLYPQPGDMIHSYDSRKMPLDFILSPQQVAVSENYYSMGDDYYNRMGVLREFPKQIQKEIGMHEMRRSYHEKPVNLD